jgi:DNA repair protein RecO
MQFSEPAIVLNTTALRDADLIVTFLGKELGKACAVAKSARRSRKRFSGGIDLFDCGTFELSTNRRQDKLYLLQSIHSKEVWPGLRENLSKMSLASFCLELTNSFTVEGDAEGGTLFNPLFLSLRRLCSSANDNVSYSIAAYFALRTLKVSGFNLLDANLPLSKSTKQWFEEMASNLAPIVPNDEKVTYNGFQRLVSYVEQTLGHPLNTTKQVCANL